MVSKKPTRGLCATLAALLWIQPALAQQEPEQPPAERPQSPKAMAEKHYEIAVRLFGEGRYRESIEEFDRAIELAPEPLFYCNRAIALIKIDEFDAAIASLTTCRDTFEGDPSELAQIDAQLQAMIASARQVRPHAQQVATGIAAGPLPERTPVLPSPPPRDGWGASDFGYLSLAAGGALLASAATLDWLSADLRSEFITEASGGRGTSRERHEELRDELETRQQIFLGLTISGAVLATTGASLVLYSYLSEDDEPAPMSLGLTPHSASISLELSW